MYHKIWRLSRTPSSPTPILVLFAALAAWTPVCADPLIADFSTDRARYPPKTTAILSVQLVNGTGHALAGGVLGLFCTHLGRPVGGPPPRTFRLPPGAKATLLFRWRPPAADFQGYLVEAKARDSSGHLLGSDSVAVDVSSSWIRFPRYGFLSGYPPQPASASRKIIQHLSRFHLNALQFYDWQFKHQRPLAGTVSAPAPLWNDLAGRPTSRRTLLDLIASAHGSGMAALNYNLLYGAWAGYDRDGVDARWGLWKNKNGTNQDSLPMPHGWQTPNLYLFNPADPGWQRFLFAQEAQSFGAYPFDGWQVDQVGDRGDEYDAQGRPVTVWKTFRPFLNAAKVALHKTIVFNNVGAYGLYDTAANSTEDAVYVECWEWAGQKTYNDLRTLIEQASTWSGGKAVILAAYNDRAYGDGFSPGNPGRFNAPGVRLTDAAVFASGGSHIELGDDGRLLDSEYFPNSNLLPGPDLMRALRRDYDFLTAYENLLRGGLTPDSGAITISGVPSGPDATPESVWAFAKAGRGFHVLHLINLVGEKDMAWRDDHADRPAPTPHTNLAVKYYARDLGTIQEARWASPDRDIASAPLKFTQGVDGRGEYVRFTVPRLEYWDMIFFRTALARKAKP